MNRNLKNINGQRGAVLIVSLIMLLLLTLVGLSGMRGTSLQENMASNLRESQVAYQAAEAALQMGLRKVRETYDDCDFDKVRDFTGKFEYTGLKEKVTKIPSYTVHTTYAIRGDLDPTAVLVDGFLVRVDAVGYGLATDANNNPITETELHATYEVNCFR